MLQITYHHINIPYLLSCRSRQRERLKASVVSILLVCLSVAKMQKNMIFSKTKKFRPMVSIDDLKEVVHGLFKEPIMKPLKFNMAEIRHLVCCAKMQKRDCLEN